ncbi:hypothetical protein D1AOALGA4SA_6023 [Olavius algarvensis Delta 1 endosymbiont]|nr:hypothetical protein D1AOALGA4SA_6023 [Olavius algarvensis Delta 1 endosymbiont]
MVNQTAAKSPPEAADQPAATCVTVDSGICGFACRIKAWKTEKRAVGLAISESECRQIQQFSQRLANLTLRDVFAPISRNPVYLAAEKTGCHPSCPIPPAVLKAAEVALEMALPRDAAIRFEACQESVD